MESKDGTLKKILSVGKNVSFVVLIFCAYLNKIKDVSTLILFL